MKSKAIVLGLYEGNGLGVTRSLGYEKIPIIGFNKKGLFPHASYSKYMQASYFVDNESELIEKLMETGMQQEEKGVLFATGDDYVLFCQDYSEDLQKYYHVPLVKEKNLHNLLEKKSNLKIGQESGFKIPESQYLSEPLKLEDKIIAKPLSSVGTSKQDIFIFDNKYEIEKAKDKLIRKYKDMLLMQYIEGGVKEHFEIHTYNSSQGVLIAGMLQKIHALKNSTHGSVGALAQSVWIDELVKAAKKLTEKAEFNGALDINLKKNALDNEFYFTEVNYRTSGNLMLDTISGLNLPAIIYYDLNEKDISHLISKSKRLGIKWLSEGVEIAYLRSGIDNDVIEYNNEMQKIESYVFFDETDMLPFLKAIETDTLIFKPSEGRVKI
ncbi:MAG: hypothetical protein KJ767_03825 [Nanoarchaeota archaeon]|nr:hypothetical protein [Nanoarchaeota archaeon]